jgi:hypothetical protein
LIGLSEGNQERWHANQRFLEEVWAEVLPTASLQEAEEEPF